MKLWMKFLDFSVIDLIYQKKVWIFQVFFPTSKRVTAKFQVFSEENHKYGIEIEISHDPSPVIPQTKALPILVHVFFYAILHN